MHQDRLILEKKVALLVTATGSAHQITFVTSGMVSVPAGSRPVVVSVTFALQGTGDFPLVNHVFVITTRPLGITRLENVSTFNTAPRERTVKFARLVTMVIPRVVHQTIAFGASARAVAVKTSSAKPVFWIVHLLRRRQSVTPVKKATLEDNAKNATTVTLGTHSSQAVAASLALAITTSTHLTLATVTG